MISPLVHRQVFIYAYVVLPLPSVQSVMEFVHTDLYLCEKLWSKIEVLQTKNKFWKGSLKAKSKHYGSMKLLGHKWGN